ncbi:MAG: hypothetical protein PHF46_02755, partial [Candidatus Gracilibacteria bacterium]|nr:hypothetical protein [Candidatus Gracilibacteria bacterium]
MKIFKVNLISNPNFFEDKEIINNFEYINFNSLFWDNIFNASFIRELFLYLEIKIKDSTNILLKKTIINVQKSYLLLKLAKNKSITQDNLIFLYRSIDNFFKFINVKDNVRISFFRDHYIKEDTSFKDKNIFRFFFEKNIDFLEISGEEIMLLFDIRFPYELYQIGIILDILKEKGIDLEKIKMVISLVNLSEFDNKLILENKIKNLGYSGLIDLIFINEEDYAIFLDNYKIKNSNDIRSIFHEMKIFGKNYVSLSFFNKGCSWRKCAFCNIGKFFADKKLEKMDKIEMIKKNIEILKYKNADCLDIFDPDISMENILIICDEIIKSGLKIKIHVRMRFDEDFSPENCGIL